MAARITQLVMSRSGSCAERVGYLRTVCFSPYGGVLRYPLRARRVFVSSHGNDDGNRDVWNRRPCVGGWHKAPDEAAGLKLALYPKRADLARFVAVTGSVRFSFDHVNGAHVSSLALQAQSFFPRIAQRMMKITHPMYPTMTGRSLKLLMVYLQSVNWG
jgi:hypothetical protein